MNRLEAMAAIAAARGDAAAITGPGANSGLLYERADSPATIYNMDMGYASAMALGVALACPDRRVLAKQAQASVEAALRRMQQGLGATVAVVGDDAGAVAEFDAVTPRH